MDRMSLTLSVSDSISLLLACHILHAIRSSIYIQYIFKMFECCHGDVLCAVLGHSCSASLRKAICAQPSTTGYNFGSAVGTITIHGFDPTGVACANGYSGTVTYAVCASAGDEYQVSGCEVLPSKFICALLGVSRPFKVL